MTKGAVLSNPGSQFQSYGASTDKAHPHDAISLAWDVIVPEYINWCVQKKLSNKFIHF